MYRAALFLAFLAPLLTEGQPYASVSEWLLAQGCNRACVCRNTECSPPNDCRPVNLSIPWGAGGDAGWGRYGFPARPTHIGDGTHDAWAVEAARSLLRPENPAGIAGPWPRPLAAEEVADLSKLWCGGGKSARAMVIQRFGEVGGEEGGPPPATNCYPGWNCSPMPDYLVIACTPPLDPEYNCRPVTFRASDKPGCWQLGGRSHLGVAVNFAKGKTGCDPAVTAPPKPPPAICGDGNRDPGETCSTCPADQPPGACDVVDPGPVGGWCAAALDVQAAARAALAEAQATEAAAWAVVKRECRR